jgi:hypothetical protein
MDEKEFGQLKQDLIKKFSKEYECDVSDEVTKQLGLLKI